MWWWCISVQNTCDAFLLFKQCSNTRIPNFLRTDFDIIHGAREDGLGSNAVHMLPVCDMNLLRWEVPKERQLNSDNMDVYTDDIGLWHTVMMRLVWYPCPTRLNSKKKEPSAGQGNRLTSADGVEAGQGYSVDLMRKSKKAGPFWGQEMWPRRQTFLGHNTTDSARFIGVCVGSVQRPHHMSLGTYARAADAFVHGATRV
jgi:hypothetical protein